jgi:hypothetical protein
MSSVVLENQDNIPPDQLRPPMSSALKKMSLSVIEQGVEASKLLMLPAKSLSEQLKLLYFTFCKAGIENKVSK